MAILRIPSVVSRALFCVSASMMLPALAPAALYAQAPAVAPKSVGTVQSITADTVVLSVFGGKTPTVTVTFTPATTVLQLPAGSTDLKAASPATVADIAIGDRLLVNGKVGDDPAALNAARIIVMKSGDLAALRTQQQADWQKNGTSGLVRAIDGTTLTVGSGTKSYKVSTSPATLYKRYADDSVKYEDAKPGMLSQVHTGDQISVRGPKSDDGTSITAAEIVTGTFENLSGSVSSVDTAMSTITLKDLISKKTVTIHVTPNSDLRKLPAQAAAMFATRNAPPAAGGGAAPAGRTPPPAGAGADAGARRAGMDLSRMLSRLPTITVADIKPGDAVMIVASSGKSDSLTAITMLSGVEQLLSATPSGAQPITLSPWTLGVPEGAGGGGGGQ